MVAGFVIIGIVVLILLWVIAAYNGLVKKRIATEEGFSTMDVYLKKRFDLIPNLVETVKGYAKHESETLQAVIAGRGGNYGSMSDAEKIETGEKLSRMIPNILALAEQYPDLKANQNFMQLSGELSSLENDIANARKYYNGTVKNYNMACQTVPSNIIASIFNFQTKRMFEVSDEAQRENVKVSF